MRRDRHFKALKKKVSRARNIDLGQYKDSFLDRRFCKRMQAVECADMGEYMSYLDREPGEYGALMDCIDVNVTEFFRDPETFKAIEREVIPAVVKQRVRAGDRTIKAWSAGSADGKETYSLAILLREALGDSIRDFKVDILGTDRDPGAIERARKGVYISNPQNDLRRMIPGRYIDRYFEVSGDTFRVRPGLKELTRFERHDLISGPKMKGWDLILCRNVAIYFEPKLQESLCVRLHDALRNGGFLVVGRTEAMVGRARDRLSRFNPRERIFRRVGEAESRGKEKLRSGARRSKTFARLEHE